jgi:hypothetical protein
MIQFNKLPVLLLIIITTITVTISCTKGKEGFDIYKVPHSLFF